MRCLLPTSARRHALGAAVLLAAVGCHQASGDAEAGPPEVAAHTMAVQASDYVDVVSATGTVVPAPGTSTAMSAPAAARVARVYVAEGDRVRPGDPLVAFDRTVFDAELARAEAAVENARRARERAARLTDVGVAPRKELDQATAALADADAALVAARRVQQLLTLRASRAGVVARVDAVQDATVDPTRPVVEIVDPDAIEVVFGVTPRAAAAVHPGTPVALVGGSSAGGEALGTARVIAVGSTVDSTSRTVVVRARVSGRVRPLRIGESVLGRISGPSRAGVITVPVAALVPEGERFHVFVVDRSGLAHARQVAVVAQDDSVAHIASGLAPGEVVVTTGAFGVDEGARIVAPPGAAQTPVSATPASMPASAPAARPR